MGILLSTPDCQLEITAMQFLNHSATECSHEFNPDIWTSKNTFKGKMKNGMMQKTKISFCCFLLSL